MYKFSVITPTFNRANHLPAIFNCLLDQEVIDLEWVIVDDGSTDNTKDIVSQFDGPFRIKYHYQQNSGKPTAANKGVELSESYISIIHDDDDTLLPKTLPLVWKYFDITNKTFQEECACLSGLCIYDNGEIIGDKFQHDYYISNHIEYQYNKNIRGDKCEFYLTSVLKNYPFPIIKNEKYIGESIVWSRIALKYKTIYINNVFQKKVFLKGGLSDQAIWDKYPLGRELFFNEASNPKFSLILRIKHYANYIYYAKNNNKNILQIYSSSNNKSFFLPGLFFYFILIIWRFLKKFTFINNLRQSKRNGWQKIT